MFVCLSGNDENEPEETETFTLDDLNRAFDRAENETSDWFNQKTCSMENRQGEHECPICFFRRRVKSHLDVNYYNENEHNRKGSV